MQNNNNVSWKKVTALSFHFHESNIEVKDWNQEDWTYFRRLRAMFWGSVQDSELSEEEINLLFSKKELPDKFRKKLEEWSPARTKKNKNGPIFKVSIKRN